MGLFSSKKENFNKNYVSVLSVLNQLHKMSDEGWMEVARFITKCDLKTLDTYYYSDVRDEPYKCNEIRIEHAYSCKSHLGCMQDKINQFLFNNLHDLDGEDLENKIISKQKLKSEFSAYYWLKEDLKNISAFNDINILENIEQKRIIEKKESELTVRQALKANDKKYLALIYCIENFCEQFDQTVSDIAKFLKLAKFHENCDVHIRIAHDLFLKLNRENSEESIYFVLDTLSDSKWSKNDLGMSDEYFTLSHILIDEDDLKYFGGLDNLLVNIKVGHTVYEDIKYKDIILEDFELVTSYLRQEDKKIFDKIWEDMKEKNSLEVDSNKFFREHPSLNPEHKNHAPELLIAMEAWEAKYLKNEYPHHEHTPAITNFLKSKNITQVNLVKRICAITNPKK